jgi:soluble lytic murein transglycosylase
MTQEKSGFTGRSGNSGTMNGNTEQDDLRERVATAMASPWVPVAAALVFLLAILAALLSVLFNSRNDGQQVALTEVIRTARAGNHVQASQLALSLKRPPDGLPKLLQWFYLIDPKTPIEAIELDELDAFLTANQHWPGTKAMEVKRERLLAQERSPAEMLEYYAEFKPTTEAGRRRALQAQLQAGDFEDAVAKIRRLWASKRFAFQDELTFEETFADYLREEDYRARVSHLLMGKQRADARRFYDHLNDEWRAFAEALDADIGGDSTLREALPISFQRHPAFVLPEVLALDAAGENDAAQAALARIPPDLRVPELEWRARHILIRQALKEQNFDLALGLAQRHGLDVGNDRAEAEWMKGWIALTRLGLPHPAQEAFERSLTFSEDVRLQDRARYWLAQAMRARGLNLAAEHELELCAAHAHSFYGQACMSALGRKLFENDFPRANANKGLKSDELAELTFWANTLWDMEIGSLAERFVYALSTAAQTPSDFDALVTLARENGKQRITLIMARNAAERGLYELKSLLPKLTIEPARGLRVDEALVHAIAWQESKFQTGAVSRSGALGLMQILPPTARAMAQRHDLEFKEEALTRDARYNLTLGAAYLQDLQSRFKDADLLAISAYNAGPGNTQRWMREFGDPRTNAIEPLVWMESISYGETRDYARRVTALYNLYRARFANGPVEILMPRHLLGSRS